jgi:hypothetical protein
VCNWRRHGSDATLSCVLQARYLCTSSGSGWVSVPLCYQAPPPARRRRRRSVFATGGAEGHARADAILGPDTDPAKLTLAAAAAAQAGSLAAVLNHQKAANAEFACALARGAVNTGACPSCSGNG